MNMLERPRVIILLATYNGEKYLSEQLESILKQTYTNWLLVIRDDQSNDSTGQLISKYTGEYKNIVQINTQSDKKGALFNFANLYLWAKNNLDPEYIMFCDQDDSWQPGKIEASMNYMKEMEEKYSNEPLLLYTDLELMNENGKKLDIKINVLHHLTLNQVIAQNYCFGCTMLLNRKLIKLIDSISDKAENHDYWIALMATALGRTIFLNKPGVLYRQHRDNVTSQGNSIKNRFHRYTKGLNKKINTINTTRVMLEDFNAKYGELLEFENKTMIQEYLNSYKRGFIAVAFAVFKYKIFRLNFLQNLAYLFLIYKYFQKQLAVN